MPKPYTYLDYNATTPLDPDALKVMVEISQNQFYNPSSLYYPAQVIKEELEKARLEIKTLLGGKNGQLIFTSGGSEADNLAIKGVARFYAKKGRHLLISAIEHHAVLEAAEALVKEGFELSLIPVNSRGVVDLKALENLIRPDTILISVMHANNETGVIQPIQEIAEIAKQRKVLFHTDAVQTVGKIAINIEELGVDLLSFSAHKFYGPKGAGGLWIKKGVALEPLIHGGSQEWNLRAGTENPALILGMLSALKTALPLMQQENQREEALRNALEKAILETIPDVQINGGGAPRLSNTLNASFHFVEGEALLMYLSEEGICVSSGSACSSSSLEPSHVLLAMGLSHEIAHGSLRFSFGRQSGEADVKKVMETLPGVIEKLRRFSPFGRGKDGFWDQGVPRDAEDHAH